MSKSVGLNNISDAIHQNLTIYSAKIVDEIKKEAEESMKKLVEITKDTAPVGKRKKHYKNQITYSVLDDNTRGATYVWHVKGDYRLSHLLEHGHAKRNGGRTKAFGFLSDAENKIIPEFEKKIEEVIKNG